MTVATRRNVILFREESSYGVDPTPTPAANAILALDLDITIQGDKLERNPGMRSLSRFNPIIGKRWIEITFGVELRGSGSAGTAAKWADLLEVCGMTEAVTGGVSVAYSLNSSSQKSGTLYAYMDSVVWKIPGCRGSWELVGDVNQISRCNFTLMAPYVDYIDEALPSGCVYDPRPEPFLSAALTYDSLATLKIQQFQCNLQNELAPSEDINHADGVSAFTIAGRNPIGSFNPELVTKATKDFYGKWKASTAATLSVVFGQTAGKKVTLTAPSVTLDSVKPGDRGGIRIFDIPISFGQTAENNEIVLTFS